MDAGCIFLRQSIGEYGIMGTATPAWLLEEDQRMKYILQFFLNRRFFRTFFIVNIPYSFRSMQQSFHNLMSTLSLYCGKTLKSFQIIRSFFPFVNTG